MVGSCWTRDRQLEGNAVTPTLTPTTSPAPFTTADRCDRCQAQGKVRVVLAGGGDLMFCGHHAREYDARIRELAVEVVTSDENPN
jgi:hypothetical protein